MLIGLIFPPLRICSDIFQQEEGFVILLPDFSISEVATSISNILGAVQPEENISETEERRNICLNDQSTILCQTKIDQNIPQLDHKTSSPEKSEQGSLCDSLLDNEENLFVLDNPDDNKVTTQQVNAEVSGKDIIKGDKKRQKQKKIDSPSSHKFV